MKKLSLRQFKGIIELEVAFSKYTTDYCMNEVLVPMTKHQATLDANPTFGYCGQPYSKEKIESLQSNFNLTKSNDLRM